MARDSRTTTGARTDALNRRRRTARPQPRGREIVLHGNDFRVFEAIHRHGPLPSHYLHAFTDSKSLTAFQHRLTKLYNGTGQGHYLTRPAQQFDSFHARYQPLVYDLTERARRLLSEHGRWSPYLERTDPFLHRLMGACVGAAIELACPPLRYIPRSEILARNGHPLKLPLSVAAAQKQLVPDDLFGLDYGGRYRFFAVEIDRGTETIAPGKKSARNTVARKLSAYLDVMRRTTYREVWGIPNFLVIIVTTNAVRMHHIMAYLLQRDRQRAERFLFRALPTFGSHWRIPPILTEMLEPWPRADGSVFDIGKA